VDQFRDGAVEMYEQALMKAKKEGVVVKGLVICNPHNPLGKCSTSLCINIADFS
jgi:1-aminocyclopropane-1-carboxylate synthase